MIFWILKQLLLRSAVSFVRLVYWSNTSWGSIGGILICDYFVIRRTRLDLIKLYEKNGPYWYTDGFNIRALVALAVGILPNLPGFLGTIKVLKVHAFWTTLYSYAWFVGFGLSFATYLVLSWRDRAPRTEAA